MCTVDAHKVLRRSCLGGLGQRCDRSQSSTLTVDFTVFVADVCLCVGLWIRWKCEVNAKVRCEKKERRIVREEKRT